MQVKSIVISRIKGHPKAALLCLCKREDIRDAIGIVPHCSVSAKFSDQSCTGDTGIAMDVHRVGMFSDVGQEVFIAKHVNGGLVVEKNPVLWQFPISLNLHDNTFVLSPHVHVDELVLRF